MLILAWYAATHCAKASSTSWYMTGRRVLVFPFTVSSRASSSAERCRVLLIVAYVTVTWWISSNHFTRALWLRAGLSLLYRQRAMRRDSVRWLWVGLGDFAIVGCWWRKKTGHALPLCTSSVTKSIYKSLYSLGNWATYLGIQFEAETGRSSIFQNVPWCSVPTDSCGSDRINQVLYRQEGSKTFHDFPRGLCDLL